MQGSFADDFGRSHGCPLDIPLRVPGYSRRSFFTTSLLVASEPALQTDLDDVEVIFQHLVAPLDRLAAVDERHVLDHH